MIKPESDGSGFTSTHADFERLLREGIECLGFSGPVAEHSVARRTVDLRGVAVSVISLGEPQDMHDNDIVLAAQLYGAETQSPHALEFLFEINLANTLAGAGAFGRDSEGNLLLLKAMRCHELNGMTLAAHMQWMVALIESVREELRRIH